MELYENSECLWESSRKTRCESGNLSFFKHRIVLGMVFVLHPGVLNRCEFTSAVVIHVTSMGKHVSPLCSLSLWFYPVWTHESFTQVTCLNPQGIHYLILWIKLTIAWNFSLPHLLAPLPQVPPPTKAVNKWCPIGTWSQLWNKSGGP